MNKGAYFSDCGKYRYALWRVWDESKPKAMCIGLNPSTANAMRDDNTISVLKIVLTQLGYGGFYMMNLYGLISSKPAALSNCPDPVGKENGQYFLKVLNECSEVIFCWGNFKQAKWRASGMSDLFQNAKCFGKTKDGSPFHPRALSYKGQLRQPKLIPFK